MILKCRFPLEDLYRVGGAATLITAALLIIEIVVFTIGPNLPL
jgi:hypothetical protein